MAVDAENRQDKTVWKAASPAPVLADAGNKPLFSDSCLTNYRLVRAEMPDGVLRLNYQAV